MSITTLSTLVTKLQYPRDYIIANSGVANLVSNWAVNNVIPGSGAYNATLNGVTLTSPQTGQIPFPNPVGTGYLARSELMSNQNGFLIVADRIWHNGGYTITSTSAQLSTTPTWPARDINGATAGEGFMMAVEISSTVGAATPTITISYTNSAGTSGRTATNVQATSSGASTGRMVEIGLQAGDTGVKSIQSLTLSASYISGTINLVVFRPILMMPLVGSVASVVDAIGGCLPTIPSGAVPYTYYNCASAANLSGKFIFADG